MANEAKQEQEKKPKVKKSELLGHQAQPTVLKDITKLDVDIDRTLMDHLVMAGLAHNVDTDELNRFTSISNSRESIYQNLDIMCQDSAVSAVVRTYTEDTCEAADNGHIVWAESNDPKISKHINYLLNVANVDKNVYGWVYNLVKYGDVYLKLFRESDYEDDLFHDSSLDTVRRGRLHENLDESIILSTHRQSDPYSYYVEMVPDPSTMFELTKYGKTYGFIEVPNDKGNAVTRESTSTLADMNSSSQMNVGSYNYKMKSDDVIIHQADEYVHAYLDDGYTRFPETVDIFLPRDSETSSKSQAYSNTASYTVRRGKSLLYDAYKIWREKQLLEAAALLSRLTRSSVIRKVGVEMGNTSKEKSAQILRAVKEMFEQRTAYNTDTSMSEYNNPGAVENFIYHAIRDGKGAITVDTIGGDYDPKSLIDLDWWNNKFYGSFGIPKQYFGWCLKFDTPIQLLDGTTHTIEELYNNKDIYIGKGILGCNTDGSLCPTKITNIMLTNPNAKYMRIWLDNGNYVDVTPDHRMMLRSGEFVRADELNEGDSLMPYYSEDRDGRLFVLDNKLGKFRAQYQVVAEKAGIPVENGYNIHHKDENKHNDDFDNLVKLTTAEHCAVHNFNLSAMHRAANIKRHSAGKPINANVGGRYITNGVYYTTIKSGEQLPEGFWYEGPKKPESMKKAISAVMKGRAKNYDNASHLNTPAVRERSLAARQKTYDLRTGNKDFLTRCPVCGMISTRHISEVDYNAYLAKNRFYYCSYDCHKKLDGNNSFIRSLRLFHSCEDNLNIYSQQLAENAKSGYLQKEKFEAKLADIAEYVPAVNHKVVKIEYFEETVPVYDLTVADDCHTFALPCGIFVHNCEDGAGFNGGTALTITSSVYGKGVKRVQNAMIQALNTMIDLFLVKSGCKAYLNNYVIKMKFPLTQEEISYRENLTSRVNAISSTNSLFTDVETKSTRLRILKDLMSTLNYGDDLLAAIDEEIKVAKDAEAKAKAAEEEATNTENGGEEAGLDLGGDTDAGDTGGDDLNLDLSDIPAAPDTPQESFRPSPALSSLTEDTEFLDESTDLLNPNEIEDGSIDFSENN